MKHKCCIAVLFLALAFPLVVSGLTIEEEKKYGKEMYLQIAGSVPINNDPYISIYLQGVKNRLESVTSLPFPITLTIIESQAVNAFAAIGGYVYVTTGLIGFSESEEEFAGVLAHELAHITRRHVAKRLEKEKYINIGMLATVLAGVLVGDSKAKEAIMVGGMASAQALSLKYSREDEDEADRLGATVADNAGYSGLGIAEFLKKLRTSGRETTIPQYLLTHPYHEERIAKIEGAWGGSKTRVDTSFYPFLAIRANLLHRPPGAGIKEIWLNKYRKDKNDPMNAYGASLAFMSTGDTGASVKVASKIQSPYRGLFLGEMLVNARKWKEAAEVLETQKEPIPVFFLAKAYEGDGKAERAVSTLRNLVPYGPAFPEIYYKLGMLSGRTGKEAEGYEYLGRYYLVTGKHDLAKTNLEKAVSRYGINSKEAQELLRLLDGMKKPE
ncbi:M48 family metalloprotease [Syntrophorhabdus aromaticivorans]|uniref:M48 family metalloprotease n=1 Tax=Syntrophorhabdus aromaticivorans TaxID=328301 RepID=A0A971M492_9BACT|nr:M48 family metalloprotease [Syntrophorhabdus aromaticivorans]NLW35017.1 M48 family metalloprotease [Syntrophorhabdus aromaticivorans]